MTETAAKSQTLSCAHCGRPVTGRGAAPKSGKRYCSFNPACRAARDREAYRRRMDGAAIAMEERPCSCCGAFLPSRPKRVTDHVLGRWCSRKICQQARASTISPAGVVRAREWYKAILEIDRMFQEADIEPCPACGLPEGRVGFLHRDLRESSITGWCDAQGKTKRQAIPEEYVEAFGRGGPFAE